MRVRIKRLDDIELPQYSRSGDAAFDLPSSKDLTIEPGDTKTVPTGLALEIPKGHVGLVWDRSGLASKYGMHCFAGVVDSGYRGEVKVVMHNFGEKAFAVKKGMRVAQLIIQPVAEVVLEEADELSESTRGDKGFGSSGH